MTKTAKTIRRLRERRGLSQDALARRMRCSRSHIANIENGHREATRDHLAAVRKALGTAPSPRR